MVLPGHRGRGEVGPDLGVLRPREEQDIGPLRGPSGAADPGPRLRWVPVIAFCLVAQAQCRPIAPEGSALCSVTSNGGFEEGSELPDYWAHFPPEPQPWGRHLRDTTDCHAGTASGKLLSDEPHPPGAGVQWNRYGLPVKGGSALIVSYWMKTQGTRPIGTGCHFYDANKAHLGFVPVRPAGDCSDWTYTRAYVDVPASATTAGFALYGGDSGSTWYDDVYLLGVPSAPVSYTHLTLPTIYPV